MSAGGKMLVSIDTSSAGLGTVPVDQFVPVNQSFVVPVQFTVCANTGTPSQMKKPHASPTMRRAGRRLGRNLKNKRGPLGRIDRCLSIFPRNLSSSAERK